MDAAGNVGVTAGAEPLRITADKVMRDLDEIRAAALASGAFVPAIRCVELQGKHIGLWKSEAPQERTLEQLIAATPEIDDRESAAG